MNRTTILGPVLTLFLSLSVLGQAKPQPIVFPVIVKQFKATLALPVVVWPPRALIPPVEPGSIVYLLNYWRLEVIAQL